jgi:hypothetical protein
MIEVECDWCGGTIEKYPSRLERSDHHFCSDDCHNKFQRGGERRSCDNCEEEIQRKPSTYEGQDNVYCSIECRVEYRRADWPQLVCENCGELFKMRPALYEQRITVQNNDKFFCSNDCQGEWETGKDNPMYDGERKGHPIYGPDWRYIRRDARERDGFSCQDCGLSEREHKARYGQELEVHHIKPIREFDNVEEANQLSNLITLCRAHHRKYENLPKEDCMELKD